MRIIYARGRGKNLKKFSFRLQTVLGMREKTLEERQLEMARVVHILNQQIQKLDDLLAQKEKTRTSLEKLYESDASLDILSVTNYKNFLSKLINDVKIQEGVIENTKNVLKFKQKAVSDALKEVKIMEKLKEKQQTKFYQHYEYVQSKEIDDLASTRYHRVSG